MDQLLDLYLMKKKHIISKELPITFLMQTINHERVLELIKALKVLLGVEHKKIMFDTEKVHSLTCMEKKSSELNYSL